MDLKELRLKSVILDKESGRLVVINNRAGLNRTKFHWGRRYVGARFSKYILKNIFYDYYIQVMYFSESTVKYLLFGDKEYLKPIFEFYGKMSVKKGPYFFKEIIDGNEIVSARGYGSDPFIDFTLVKNNKRIHLKYAHELQNLLKSNRAIKKRTNHM